MAEEATKDKSAPSATTEEPTPDEKAAVVEEGPFATRWYWYAFSVSLVSLIIMWLYYGGSILWVRILYWVGFFLGIGLLLWSFIALLNRYNVAGRVGASAARFRDSRDAAGGTGDEQVVYRENIVVRGFKFGGRLIALLFLFVWNTFLRLLHEAVVLTLRIILVFYDVLYYVLYAAWSTVYYAWRMSRGIIKWALRTTWAILRILTKFPIARKIWADQWRPAIMGKWNHRVERLKEQHARHLDRQRRLAAARGKDPDKWEADYRARHHFPIRHPSEGRKGLRDFIIERQKIDYNRRDRWAAYRKGLPIPPRLHSERTKRRAEEGKSGEPRQQGPGDEKDKKQKPKKGSRESAKGFGQSNGDPRPMAGDR